MKEQESSNSVILRGIFYLVLTILAGYLIFLMTNRAVSVSAIQACAAACDTKTTQMKRVTRTDCECEAKVKSRWQISPNNVEWVIPR